MLHLFNFFLCRLTFTEEKKEREEKEEQEDIKGRIVLRMMIQTYFKFCNNDNDDDDDRYRLVEVLPPDDDPHRQ